MKKLYLALAAAPVPIGVITHYMRPINMAPRLISEGMTAMTIISIISQCPAQELIPLILLKCTHFLHLHQNNSSKNGCLAKTGGRDRGLLRVIKSIF